MRHKLTKDQIDYINENYRTKSQAKIAEYLGIGKGSVGGYMRRNGLKVSKKQSLEFRSHALRGRTTFSEKESQFIKQNYLTMPVKTMAEKLGRSGTGVNTRLRQLGLVIPRAIIEKRKTHSQFQKGAVPMNKGKKQHEFMSPEAIEKSKATRFQKGITPHNANYDGHERVTKDGYIEIRVRKGKYRLKHVHEWEKINGKLPKGHCLRSNDDDKLNTNPENWRLITRRENMLLNSSSHFPPELRKTIRLKNKLVKALKEHSK